MTERWLHELRKLREIEPPEGLWERAASLAATGTDPAQRLRPRGTGPRRMWSAIAAAAAISLVAGAIIVVRAAAGTGQPPVSGHGGRYTDPRFGWTIRYPAGFMVEHFTAEVRWSLDGIRVANFTPEVRHRTGEEPEMGWLRDFPATGVAAQIWYLGGPGPGFTPAGSSRFPLRASSFQRIRPYVGGSEPAPAYREFTADGFGFTAAVWIGPDASSAGKRAVWRVIRSLGFPRLRPGTIWNKSVYVLRPAGHYPEGSVTAFPGSSLPTVPMPRFTRGFYLVHAPRGYYVIDRLFVSPEPHAVTCTVAYDRASSRFYCPGTALRWNLVGRQLGQHGGQDGWDLSGSAAPVATDGHVLVSKSFGRLGS